MQSETQKLIDDQFRTLPINLQKAIVANPWKVVVQEIGKKNALDPEQIVSLEQEVMFLLYGFEPPKDFATNLVTGVGVGENDAEEIANDVAERILGPIESKSKTFNTSQSKPVAVQVPEAKVPEVKPDIHPMVEAGEKVHDVVAEARARAASLPPTPPKPSPQTPPPPPPTPVTTKPVIDVPRYGGHDPYREPLE